MITDKELLTKNNITDFDENLFLALIECCYDVYVQLHECYKFTFIF